MFLPLSFPARRCVLLHKLHAVGFINLFAAEGKGKRVVLGTAADTFAAQYTLGGGDVDGTDVALSLTDGKNGFDTHGARLIASAALGAGNGVLFELEQRSFVGETEDKAERADVAEASALKEAADQHDNHHKAAESEAEFKASQRGGERHRGAEVAEVAADKADSQKDNQDNPLDHPQHGVQPLVEGNTLNMQRLPRLVRHILNKPQRTHKAA